METSDWLVVEMPPKVVWSFVTVVCGALSVTICGGHQMLKLPVVNWDSRAKVITTLHAAMATNNCVGIQLITFRSCCYIECVCRWFWCAHWTCSLR